MSGDTSNSAPSVPHALIQRFGLSGFEFLTRTNIAHLWIVQSATHGRAVLKVYGAAGMRNEAAGFDYLRCMEGRGAAHIYDQHGDAALIEYLDGASLGDMSRAGQDDQAAQRLSDVALTLQADPPRSGAYPDLRDWFSDLFNAGFSAGCARSFARDIDAARAIAQQLLDRPHTRGLLHGDLHHDNVHGSARGYLAFDAKGVVGERAFELANAFRNPRGAPDVQRDRGRIEARLDLWAPALGATRKRLMGWAVAKCALSIAWRANGAIEADAEADLLALFLQHYHALPGKLEDRLG